MKLYVKISEHYTSYFSNILWKIRDMSTNNYVKITFTDDCKMTIDINSNLPNEEPIMIIFGPDMFSRFDINKKKYRSN